MDFSRGEGEVCVAAGLDAIGGSERSRGGHEVVVVVIGDDD